LQIVSRGKEGTAQLPSVPNTNHRSRLSGCGHCHTVAGRGSTGQAGLGSHVPDRLSDCLISPGGDGHADHRHARSVGVDDWISALSTRKKRAQLV